MNFVALGCKLINLHYSFNRTGKPALLEKTLKLLNFSIKREIQVNFTFAIKMLGIIEMSCENVNEIFTAFEQQTSQIPHKILASKFPSLVTA